MCGIQNSIIGAKWTLSMRIGKKCYAVLVAEYNKNYDSSIRAWLVFLEIGKEAKYPWPVMCLGLGAFT